MKPCISFWLLSAICVLLCLAAANKSSYVYNEPGAACRWIDSSSYRRLLGISRQPAAARIGYSIYIYHITQEDIDRLSLPRNL